MEVETLTTSDLGLLRGVRATLVDSEDALLCLAFVDQRGLGLIEKELDGRKRNRARSRLLVTTVFGSTDATALTQALNLGVDVRVLNPGGRTLHPKVYLGTRGNKAQAVIGSANLTAGLATNYDAGDGFAGLPMTRSSDGGISSSARLSTALKQEGAHIQGCSTAAVGAACLGASNVLALDGETRAQ